MTHIIGSGELYDPGKDEHVIRASHDPIAYIYMADHHCPDCALKAWGRDEHGDIGGDKVDAEGNPIGVVAPWDEWQHFDGEVETLACGTCGVVIETFDGAAWLEAQARAITIEEEIQEREK